MFNYVQIEFLETALQPQVVYYANFYQNRYSHELIEVKFRDWGVDYDVVAPGMPVKLTLDSPKSSREIYGYVHHINEDKSPGKNFTEVVIIGASFSMRQPTQYIYKNTTADQVVKEIASRHNFVCYAVPHPRVYPQVSQAGHSDWEFMVRLAKQSGYTLRAQNTELYFQPVMDDFTNYRESAPKFIMRPVGDPDGSTLYSFKPIIGDSVKFDGTQKAAVAVSGVDSYSGSPMAITKQKQNRKTRRKQKNEFFDYFDTSIVAPDLEVAEHEATAADERNRFPYRAKIEVLGDPELRPDLPIFLDGIGETYSGYWVILSTEHRVIEEERNRQRYTTVLTVGIDSLGEANTWVDNKTVTSPDYLPKRQIIPNVRQTKVVPTTALSNTTNAVTPQTRESFGNPKNRKKVTVLNRDQGSPTWKSTTRSLNNISIEPTKSPVVLDRILRNAGVV